jgi:hypothetical protein
MIRTLRTQELKWDNMIIDVNAIRTENSSTGPLGNVREKQTETTSPPKKN